jgi:hypothetical protein
MSKVNQFATTADAGEFKGHDFGAFAQVLTEEEIALVTGGLGGGDSDADSGR